MFYWHLCRRRKNLWTNCVQ